MFLNLHNSLPDWEDNLRFNDGADDWKWAAEIAAAKALYEQWAEVYALTTLYADSLQEKSNDDEDASFTKRLIHENLLPIAPKIRSAAGDTLYIIKMENASVIRFNCRQLMEMVGWAALNGEADPKYKSMIAEAMEAFKERFREWVAFFKPDEIEDDWGLYR